MQDLPLISTISHQRTQKYWKELRKKLGIDSYREMIHCRDNSGFAANMHWDSIILYDDITMFDAMEKQKLKFKNAFYIVAEIDLAYKQKQERIQKDASR